MINFNGTLTETPQFSAHNRGMLYGDAVFETIRYSGGKLFFWEDHYFRLMASMRILRMEIPMHFTLEDLQDELLKLQEKLQKTMVFITHDFAEAIKMGDTIAIMKDGEISQLGTPEEIVANPIDQYVKDFTEDVPKYKVLSAGKICRKQVCDETKKTFEEGKD